MSITLEDAYSEKTDGKRWYHEKQEELVVTDRNNIFCYLLFPIGCLPNSRITNNSGYRLCSVQVDSTENDTKCPTQKIISDKQ
jgi:hypothetical protein